MTVMTVIMVSMSGPDHRRTTVSVYVRDRDWLQRRQLKISSEQDKWVIMSDLVHALIEAVVKAEEAA